MVFASIGCLHLSGIETARCVMNVSSIDQSLFIEDCNVSQGSALEINVVSRATIVSTSFQRNDGSKITNPVSGSSLTAGALTVKNSDITLIECDLYENTGYTAGAALWVWNSTTSVYNSSLTGNRALVGSAVYVRQSNVTLHSSIFTRNAIDTIFGGGGPALFARGSAVIVTNCTFKENTLDITFRGRGGGAIFAINSVLFFSDSAFVNNTAIGRLPGGAIYTLHSNITIDKCDCFGNFAEERGSTISAENSSVTIQRSDFSYNTATTINTVSFKYAGYGAIAILTGTLKIEMSTFTNNIGGAVYTENSFNVTVRASVFDKNKAVSGAGVRMANSTFTIDGSTFTNNFGSFYGGSAVSARRSNGTISKCMYSGNTARTNIVPYLGGAVIVWSGVVTISNSAFFNNTGITQGGGVAAREATLRIENCDFVENTAVGTGGGILSGNSNVSLYNCSFYNNKARFGGAIYMVEHSLVLDAEITFIGNSAANDGAAIFIQSTNLTSSGSLNIENNMANLSVFYILVSSVSLEGNTTISNNNGSLLVRASNMTLTGQNILCNNSHSVKQDDLGGAVTSYQSTIYFTGQTILLNNKAERGGAILATASNIHMFGEVTIAQNIAYLSGGGIYAHQCELTFNGNTDIVGNLATRKGGGIHALSTNTMLSGGFLTFLQNEAERGGGMFLELNARLHVVKKIDECGFCSNSYPEEWLKLEFKQNSAEYGGALFVSDETNPGTCDAVPFSVQPTLTGECFFQTLGLHTRLQSDQLNLLNTYFTNNTASVSGKTLYGGLLDRCSVSFLAEVFQKFEEESLNPQLINGVSYLTEYNITNLQESSISSDISSDPVRVCFCKGNKPHCNFPHQPIHTRKGEMFKLSVAALDQVGNAVPSSSIRSSLSQHGGLREGQTVQTTTNSCTELEYNIFSPLTSEELVLYADGPCGHAQFSKASVAIDFIPCPTGFKELNAGCDCDPDLFPTYVVNCSIPFVLRADDVWFSFINKTNQSGYLTHKYCPFDYCHPSTVRVYVDLNIRNGADALCAFNRTGKLCGACENGLSLSLGSTHCKSCSNSWLALLIVFAIAGIALVAFLLVCNLTVAVGTMNGLIFYANTITTNRAILLPFERQNFLTVFIAWLNLDFGFETCFYDGLDGYSKVWLQLVFPAYIIVLVSVVIFISEKSRRFTKLLSNTNPVATLATLILLSYTKLLRTIIASLSYTMLEYPDGSHERVWLVDANILYFEGKHIPLFIVALIILTIGLAYTFLLFFWQGILRCPNNKRPLRWISNVRLNSFMEAYHAPFNKRHRYWTGLLLLVRVLLYVITIVTFSFDPTINLLSIIFLAGMLLALKELRIYRKWPINILESSFLLNLVLFAAATLYLRKTNRNQAALALTSTIIAFITYVGILVYHTYTFVLKHFRFFNTLVQKAGLKHSMWKKRKKQKLIQEGQGRCEENSVSRVVTDFSKFRGPTELFESVHTMCSDYSEYKPAIIKKTGVTHTVVGITNTVVDDSSEL